MQLLVIPLNVEDKCVTLIESARLYGCIKVVVCAFYQ